MGLYSYFLFFTHFCMTMFPIDRKSVPKIPIARLRQPHGPMAWWLTVMSRTSWKRDWVEARAFTGPPGPCA